MSRNLYSILEYDSSNTQTFTLGANSSKIVDVDLNNLQNLQLLVEVLFTGLASSITLNSYYGFGNADVNATGGIACVLNGTSGALFSDNGDSVSLASSQVNSTGNYLRTFIIVDDLLVNNSRWLRLKFTNSHGSLAATVKIYADA